MMREGFETPNPKYLNHEECGKSGLEMASVVVSELRATKSLKTVIALGFDSTSSNTGIKKGSVTLIEKTIDKALQWIPCMMHFAELPLRHLYCHFDGPATGPVGPNGDIGVALKALNDNLRPFVDYIRIQSNVPIVPRALFRGKQDQIVFYDLVRGVESGVIDPVYVTKQLQAKICTKHRKH
jgi:hypothetical protein